MKTSTPEVSICVLTYGDYPQLAKRCLNPIIEHCPRGSYQLIVGANAVGHETREYLRVLQAAGCIDELIVSPANLNKCPMMRLMFERVNAELVWWFDDDVCLTAPDALEYWLETVNRSAPRTVMWGQTAYCAHPKAFWHRDDAVQFVRSAPWYRGLTPPYEEPGGKGELNWRNTGKGDGRWFFILGGAWMIRSAVLRELDWPDRRLVKNGDDVFLGEALRQAGYGFAGLLEMRVDFGNETRRGQAW
jgi:hypothetical protein